MRTVLRVEHFDGWGMFISYKGDMHRQNVGALGLSEINERHSNFNTPDEDMLNAYKDDKEWFCAYKSVEQLQKWLTPQEIEILSKNGYKVLMLDVEEYQEGRDQVIFTKESIISSKDVTKLFL